ncbi:MAG: hypothetical protein J3K34DRAFT_415519 [Monoraphidium minutum]|nr:MAG: hypothetical protein J3K34DRAFT_415519 [Monoraphidium minutum]
MARPAAAAVSALALILLCAGCALAEPRAGGDFERPPRRVLAGPADAVGATLAATPRLGSRALLSAAAPGRRMLSAEAAESTNEAAAIAALDSAASAEEVDALLVAHQAEWIGMPRVRAYARGYARGRIGPVYPPVYRPVYPYAW